MNVHESEKIIAQLSGAGYTKTDSEQTADIIIFNTCCIRNTAEQKIISHIGETKQSGKIVCIVGCLSQRDGSVESLKKKFPHIAIILGTHNIGQLATELQQYISTKKKFSEIIQERTNEDLVQHSAVKNTSTAQSHADSQTAYINITYGCENFCSYCIVPYVRGKLISRDFDLIKQELLERLKSNPKIIMLLGQNVNSYVCPTTGADFPTLLESLCKEIAQSQNSSLRGGKDDEATPTQKPDSVYPLLNFMSSHPKDFSTRLIEVIAANTQIERNIHLPLQSGCDRILDLMNRGYTVAEYESKINTLRKAIPNVRITTDIICGFPSETEDDFQQTIDTMKRIRFNAAFIFPYSRRSGTVADKMPNQIDSKTKKARSTTLIKIQREISKTITG